MLNKHVSFLFAILCLCIVSIIVIDTLLFKPNNQCYAHLRTVSMDL